MVGSIISLGCSLRMTSVGGTNCFSAIFGSLPLPEESATGRRHRHRPAWCSSWAHSRGSQNRCDQGYGFLTLSCTVLLKETVNNRSTTVLCSADRVEHGFPVGCDTGPRYPSQGRVWRSIQRGGSFSG